MHIDRPLSVLHAPRNSVRYYACGFGLDKGYFEGLIQKYDPEYDLYEEVERTKFDLMAKGFVPNYVVAIIYPDGKHAVVASQIKFVLKIV